ncbi:MAG: DUF6178 family protein [Deltaproteobacteria bacterium]|jgi:hypothetical protein|nr:DUF6178 family protein [Deltaproteobacteria bacterium]
MLQERPDITPLKLLELPPLQAENLFNRFSLLEQVSLVLAAPWDRRHELIALSVHSMAIVRGMPPQELFWTVKAVGPADSLEIISMASADQIQFMLDFDCWNRDRLLPEKVLAWLVLLFEAGETVVPNWLNWLKARDDALLPYILRMFVSVQKRPDDMDIQEAKDVLPAFTLDDIYFLDFAREETIPVIERLLKAVLDMSFEYYQGVMELLLYKGMTEHSEDAYVIKRARLEEWGVPDYIDALEIYAPLVRHGIRTADGMKFMDSSSASTELVPAFAPSLYVGEYPVLRRALQHLVEDRAMERIVFEWIGVANKILVADACDLDDPEQMLAALDKTSGFLNLGLEAAETRMGAAPFEILGKGVLEDIIRFAMSEIQAVSREARVLHKSGLIPSDLSLVQDHQRMLLEGLLRSRPVFWDDDSFSYVAFSGMSQIDSARKAVREVMEWAVLVSRLLPHWSIWQGLVLWESTNIKDYKALNWQTALSTALVKQILTGMPVFEPIDMGELWSICRIYDADPVKCRRDLEDALRLLTVSPLNAVETGCESRGVSEKRPVPQMETFLPALNALCDDLDLLIQMLVEDSGFERWSNDKPAFEAAVKGKIDFRYLSSLVVMTG